MRERVLTAVAGLGLAAAVALPSPASATAGRQVRVGVAPALPAGATLVSGVPASRPLHLTVALRPADPGALRAYAEAVSSPGSSLFRHYLTPARFARRFAPTQSEADSVAASLRAHGLTPGPRTANGLSIPVLTTVGGAARAFGLGFALVRLPGGRRAVVASAAPAVDRSVAGLVQAVIGLNGVERPRPMRVARAPRAAPEPARGHAAPA